MNDIENRLRQFACMHREHLLNMRLNTPEGSNSIVVTRSRVCLDTPSSKMQFLYPRTVEDVSAVLDIALRVGAGARFSVAQEELLKSASNRIGSRCWLQTPEFHDLVASTGMRVTLATFSHRVSVSAVRRIRIRIMPENGQALMHVEYAMDGSTLMSFEFAVDADPDRFASTTDAAFGWMLGTVDLDELMGQL